MASRKRQRPCAQDFFDLSAPKARTTEEPAERKPLDFSLGTIGGVSTARAEEYLAVLAKLSRHAQVLELIRGKDTFNFAESSAPKRHLYILKANDSEGEATDLLEMRHIATLLWGPGKREVAQGKTIYLAPLHFKSNEARSITTVDVYAIEFSSQRAMEIASEVVEYHLNQFLRTLPKDENKPRLMVQTRPGTDRWLLKDPAASMSEAKWKDLRKQIPLLRPLAKPKASPPPAAAPAPELLAFELSQLPPSFTIPTLIGNLLRLRLLSLPSLIKITQEAHSDTPVRFLLKFPERTSAVICKINIFKFGLTGEGSDRINVLIDEGDSSVEDPWMIWCNASIWEEEKIQGFVQSRTRTEGAKVEEEIDELAEETKTGMDASGSHEVEEFFASSDEFSDTPHARPPRKKGVRSYRQSLLARQAQVEKLIAKLTLEAEEEFLENRAAQDGRPKSAFYNVSEQVGDERKYHKLMKQLERKRTMRRKLKNYRKIKELPAKIKLQRKEWRREQREKFRQGAGDAGDESSGEESGGWGEQESDQSEEPKERPNKRIHTNDEIYRHKFARPHEVLPGDVA